MSIHILNSKHGVPAAKLISEEAKCRLERRKQRRHELLILTCYVDLSLVQRYINDLLKVVRVTNVYLAFNYAEIYKKGPVFTSKQLSTISENLQNKGVDFQWQSLASSNLVHGKGYALIQRSADASVLDGMVLTTSANFTGPGFNGGNIEIGYLSTRKKDINSFENRYNYLWNHLGRDIGEAVFKQERYLFKFALLSSGIFLHKWMGSLSQQVGIKYELTTDAKKRGTIAPELAALGFEAGNTFTRRILKLDALPKKEVPKSFINRYTIETYWGRWCPQEAWLTLSKSFEGADEFIQMFQAATEENVLQKVISEALIVQYELIDKGLIKPVGENHIAKWASRIAELRSNTRKLERYFMGYEAHHMPYTIEQKNEVEELFENLEEVIGLSQARNTAKKKILAAIENADPTLVALTKDEKQAVKSMRN